MTPLLPATAPERWRVVGADKVRLRHLGMHPSETDEHGLLRKVARGDAVALETVLHRHRSRLKRMVAIRMDARLAARIDASDVVQETLLDASRRIVEFAGNPVVPVYVWFRQIAQDRLADLHERHLILNQATVG